MKKRLFYGIATLTLLLIQVMPTLAQEETGGRVVTTQDWIDFMPVFIGAIVVVIIVDAFFIVPIFRKKNTDGEA